MYPKSLFMACPTFNVYHNYTKKEPLPKVQKRLSFVSVFYMCRKRTDSHRAMSRFACATEISSSSAIRSYVARSIKNRLTMRRLRSPRTQRSTPAATSAFERPSYRSLRRVILHTFRARLLRVCRPVAPAKPHGVGQDEQPRQERRQKSQAAIGAVHPDHIRLVDSERDRGSLASRTVFPAILTLIQFFNLQKAF